MFDNKPTWINNIPHILIGLYLLLVIILVIIFYKPNIVLDNTVFRDLNDRILSMILS